MHDSDMNVHDVANALKRWFKSLPGSLLTEELHDQWIETARKFCSLVDLFIMKLNLFPQKIIKVLSFI